MAKRELIDKEEVKDVLGDTINSEGDYRHALRLLDGLNSATEQEIVKPYLEKIRAEIEAIVGENSLDDYDFCSGLIVARKIIDKCKAESEG